MSDRASRNVLLVTNHMSSGGAIVALLRLARGLRERGHSVKVVFLQKREPIPVDKRLNTQFVIDREGRGLLDYLRIVVGLRRVIAAETPDVVISFLPLANVLSQGLARIHGVPHRIASQRNPSSSYGRIIRFLDRVCGTVGMYTRNVMVSHAASMSFESYPKSYRSRICVVRNGIEFDASECSFEEARASFGLPTDVPLIVAVGRLAHQKNHATVIRALEALPNFHFAIAGAGELHDELAALAVRHGVADRVHFLRTLEKGRVCDLLRAADLFAFPSIYEGLSNALLEALHEGLPIVASSIEPNVEVLKDDHGRCAGILVDPMDVAGWSDALRRVVDEPELAHDLRAAAKDRARAFSKDAMIMGFEREFAE